MVLPLYDDNPSGRVPYLTILFIALNVLVFAFIQPHGGGAEARFEYRHAVIPCELRQGRPLSEAEIVSGDCGATSATDGGTTYGTRAFAPDKNIWLAIVVSMFLHGSWLHLGGNLLFLWVFGNNIEERFGWLGFVAFYLAAGVVATLVEVIADPSSTIPIIGASGAIAGVMGAYIVLFPRARILTWWPMFLILVVYIPAAFVLGLWFLMQFATDPNSGVAWQAHVGGFLFGVAVAFAVRSRLKPLPIVERRRPAPRGTFGSRARPDPVHTWDPPTATTPWAPPPITPAPGAPTADDPTTWAPPGMPPVPPRPETGGPDEDPPTDRG